MGLYTLSIETKDLYGQNKEILQCEVEFRTAYYNEELSTVGFQVFTEDNRDITDDLTTKDLAYVNQQIEDYIGRHIFDIVQDHEQSRVKEYSNDDI